MKPELVVDSQCIIGEGPVWERETGKLFFIDIIGRSFHCFDGKSFSTIEKFDQSIGFAVLCEKGGAIVGLEKGFYYTALDGSPAKQLCDPEANREDGRLNDGKVDPAGRVWGGTMPVSLDTGYGEAGPDSAVYSLDENGQIKTMLKGVIQGNGLAWSADTKKFYFIDTQRFCVQEFDYDIEKNELKNGRVCVEVPSEMGIPDGMTVDDEGMIWVAMWGGSAVVRYDPKTGNMLQKVILPVPNVTSCCFGGENLDELYITTAKLGTDTEKYPLAGGVFKIRPGVTGQPSYKYKG